MPENWMFLVAAFVCSAVGSSILWWRARRPRPWDSGIVEFRREMEALAGRSRQAARARDEEREQRASRGVI